MMRQTLLYTLLFSMTLFFVSCETSELLSGDFEQTSPSTDNGTQEGREAYNRLTDNGKTFPTGQDLTREVSSPGSLPVAADCPPVGSKSTRFYTSSTKDPNYVVSLKNYEVPSRGCIPVKDVSLADAKKLMASQNLTTKGATELEQRTVGAALLRIQQLNGGPLKTGMGPGSKPYPFVFKNGAGYSSQAGSQINIARNEHKRGPHKHYGLSVAQHAHEYAHLIGNQGGYSKYVKFMGSTGLCMVSNYADNGKSIGGKHTGEQFAEVFTAFVTDPGALLNNKRTSKECKKAFDFFVQFFNKGERVKDCLK